jgi:hypothetical protein
MNWPDLAMAGAGVIGATVAIIHGLLMQKRIVRPLEKVASEDERIPNSTVRFIAPLLHVSTLAWFVGGVALFAASIWLERQGQLAIGLMVGSLFLNGAILNYRASRGRHPGWMLMATAVALIAASLTRGWS